MGKGIGERGDSEHTGVSDREACAAPRRSPPMGARETRGWRRRRDAAAAATGADLVNGSDVIVWPLDALVGAVGLDAPGYLNKLGDISAGAPDEINTRVCVCVLLCACVRVFVWGGLCG